MIQWEIQVEKKHYGKRVPEVRISGEGACLEEEVTPPSSFHHIPSDLPPAGHREFLRKSRLLAKVLQQLQASGLPGQEQAQTFLVHLYRRNCRPNTLRAYAGGIHLFLTFLRHRGKLHLEALTREDLEAFLEQEQDRGLKITTVRSHLGLVKAWMRFLIDRELVRPEVLARSITLKMPELLPRALDPEDVKLLLAVITKVRDRALVLLLLRTGMRIGEVLSATVNDLNLKERKILIYPAEKTRSDLPPVFVPNFKLELGSIPARIPGHHPDGLRCGWPIPQGTVGPDRIVFLPPALYQDLGLLQGVEDLAVEQFIPQLAIEALVVPVLPGTAWFNVERLDPNPA